MWDEHSGIHGVLDTKCIILSLKQSVRSFREASYVLSIVRSDLIGSFGPLPHKILAVTRKSWKIGRQIQKKCQRACKEAHLHRRR